MMTKKTLINLLNVHSIKLRYLVLLIVWLPVTALAQLKQYSPARNTTTKPLVDENARRRHIVNELSLPFWDDFSSAKGHEADSNLWIMNERVFVNDGQAINPPSINVATFDGYNENGVPYSNDPLETGYGDTLESQPIKMLEVAAGDRNNIYLSFFYQAGGNSEMPNPSDYLLLEFRSSNFGWVEIERFRVQSNADPARFYDTAIQIRPPLTPEDTNYYHNDFQFRFSTLGRISGAYDAWHLDYVYLNVRVDDDPATNLINEFDENTNISDRTTTRPFTTILSNGYYSIPIRHFDLDEPLVKPWVSLYSLKHVDFLQVVNYISRYTITNYSDGIATTTFDESPDPNGTETSFVDITGIPVLEHITAQTRNAPATSYFNPDGDSTRVHVEIAISGGDNDPDADYYPRYIPIDFRSNDTLRHTFLLSDYYAHDDGVAEYSAGLVEQGNQLAYRFIMSEHAGQDTLNGVYIYLPFTGGTVPQNMRIYVFPDKAGKPDSAFLYSQFVPVTRTANNIFSLIPFNEGVLVRDTFYIGYLETLTGDPGRIRVGLDASNDTGEHMYYRNSVYQEWTQNDEVRGSLMIRPRFGKATVITGVEEMVNPVSIYPNPSRGEFYMNGPFDNLQVITLTGQSVSFAIENTSDSKKVVLRNAAPGLYILRYRSGANVFTRKILIKDY